MATIRLSLSPGQNLENVTEAVGAATVTGTVELTFDNSLTLITDGSGTRAQKMSEILQIVDIFKQYLIRMSDVPQP